MIEKEKKLIKEVKNINEIDFNIQDGINNIFIRSNSSYNYIEEIIEKKILFSGSFHFENFIITLIDNSSGSYYPFAKLELNSINLDCKQDNTISSDFSILLQSYNYISCVWEPTIEKTSILYNFFMKKKIRK